MCLPLKHLEENRLAKGEHLGFEWEIVHNGAGYRCGYVRVLPGHPWFGRSYSCSGHYDDDGNTKADHVCNDFDASVHGGITFAEHGTACPTHGEADEWWVGFDCGHAGDARDRSLPWNRYGEREAQVKADPLYDDFRGDIVRDDEYVKAECISLCEQAAAALVSV